MRRTVLRDLLAHRGRVVMTLIAITLGIAAVVGAWTVSDSLIAAIHGGPVRSATGVVVQSAGKAATLTEGDLRELRRVDGVATVSGVRVGRAGLVGRDGKLVDQPAVPDRSGTSWGPGSRFRLTAGHGPARAGEVAVAAEQAKAAGLHAGDTARVLLGDGRVHRVTVSGLFEYLTLGQVADDGWGSDVAPTVAFDPATAGTVLGTTYDRAQLSTTAGARVATVEQRAEAVVGRGYRVSSGAALTATAAAAAEHDTNDLRLLLMPFAAVTLLVGMFVIANTFGMLVGQRTRQTALLRAVGASRRQVRRSVLLEALALGVVGGTTGIVVGLGVSPLLVLVLQPQGPFRFTVSPLAIVAAYLVAIVMTTGAAYGAARRAAKVSPMAALRTDATVPRDVRRRRNAVGFCLVVLSVAVTIATARPSEANLPRIVGLVGALLGVAGVLVLAPLLASVVLRPASALAGRRGGPAGRLGVRNAARDPRRTAGTATAITIGLVLVSAFGTLSSSFDALIGSTTLATIPATTTVVEPAVKGSTLTPDDLRRVRALPDVGTAVASRSEMADVDYPGGRTQRLTSAVEPAALRGPLTPHVTGGSADLHRGVVIAQNQADMLGLVVGDHLTLRVFGATIRTRVAGVYEATELQASIYVDVARVPALMRERVSTIYATGPDAAAVRAGVEAAFADRPDADVTDATGVAAKGIAGQAGAFLLMYAMFALALLIALFGVVNTLVLSVSERTREIGMIRAVGATRRLLRRSIRVESLVISVFGALLGVAGGLFLGAVMQHVMLGQRLSDTHVPFGTVALAMVGIVVAAVLAAVWPARRATGVEVLTAIAAE